MPLTTSPSAPTMITGAEAISGASCNRVNASKAM